MFCENCGAYNDDNAKFCGNCGSSMSSVLKADGSVTPEQNSAPNNTVTVNRNYSSYKSETVNNTIPEQKSITTDISYGNTAVKRSIKKSLIIILIMLLIVGAVGVLFVHYNHKEKSFNSSTHYDIVDQNVQTEDNKTKVITTKAIPAKSITTKASTAKTTVETTAKAESTKEKSYDVYFSIDDIVSASGIRLSDWELYEISDLSCDNGSANADIETVGSEVTVNNVLGVNVSDADSGTVTISGTIKSMHIVTRENIGIVNAYDTDSKYFSVTKSVGNSESDNKQLVDSYIGKWECQEMKYDGLTLSGDFNGVPVAAMFQMELRKNDTGTIMMIDEDSEKLNWQAEGDTVSVEFDGETIIFNKDGDRIVASEVIDGTKMVLTLVKVDKFTEYENDVIITSNPVNNMRGQINCHGGTVAGYTTDYVVNGGAVGKVRNS